MGFRRDWQFEDQLSGPMPMIRKNGHALLIMQITNVKQTIGNKVKTCESSCTEMGQTKLWQVQLAYAVYN